MRSSLGSIVLLCFPWSGRCCLIFLDTDKTPNLMSGHLNLRLAHPIEGSSKGGITRARHPEGICFPDPPPFTHKIHLPVEHIQHIQHNLNYIQTIQTWRHNGAHSDRNKYVKDVHTNRQAAPLQSHLPCSSQKPSQFLAHPNFHNFFHFVSNLGRKRQLLRPRNAP